MAEPYSAYFAALKAALDDAGGPFTAADAIEYWVDDALDELMPDERIIQALSGHGAHLLMCWGGGEADSSAGGGNSQRERVSFTLRYGCGAPGDDYEKALTDTGTNYWGAFAVHDWILEKVFQLAVTGYETPAELLSVRPIRLGQPGRVGMTLRFATYLLRTYSD